MKTISDATTASSAAIRAADAFPALTAIAIFVATIVLAFALNWAIQAIMSRPRKPSAFAYGRTGEDDREAITFLIPAVIIEIMVLGWEFYRLVLGQ